MRHTALTLHLFYPVRSPRAQMRATTTPFALGAAGIAMGIIAYTLQEQIDSPNFLQFTVLTVTASLYASALITLLRTLRLSASEFRRDVRPGYALAKFARTFLAGLVIFPVAGFIPLLVSEGGMNALFIIPALISAAVAAGGPLMLGIALGITVSDELSDGSDSNFWPGVVGLSVGVVSITAWYSNLIFVAPRVMFMILGIEP